MSAIPKSVVLVSSAVMWDALRAHDSQRVARNSGGPRSARGQATGSVAFSKGFGRSVSAAHSLSAHGLVGKSLVIARGAKGKGVTLGGGAAAVSLGRRKGAHEKIIAAATSAGRPDMARAALARFARLTAAAGTAAGVTRTGGRKALLAKQKEARAQKQDA